MTHAEEPDLPSWSPSQLVARQVVELRSTRGWSAQELANKCANVGAEHLNRSVIANIESGRRKAITIEELYALALVLDVSPATLLAGPDTEPTEQVAVTPTTQAQLRDVRRWLTGEMALPGQNLASFVVLSPKAQAMFTRVQEQRDSAAKRLADKRSTLRLLPADEKDQAAEEISALQEEMDRLEAGVTEMSKAIAESWTYAGNDED